MRPVLLSSQEPEKHVIRKSNHRAIYLIDTKILNKIAKQPEVYKWII